MPFADGLMFASALGVIVHHMGTAPEMVRGIEAWPIRSAFGSPAPADAAVPAATVTGAQ